eukprot:2039182-Heterocapsa_arctica.AAC.1
MGYAWICNNKKIPALAEFQNILNNLETGLQTMMMTEDVDTMTETDGEEPDGNTNKYTMTEEDAKKVAEIT